MTDETTEPRHYLVSGHFPGYLAETVDVACGLAQAFDMLADACERQADELDEQAAMCADDGHYLSAEELASFDAAEVADACDDCRRFDAYAELLYSTRDELTGHADDELPTTVRVLGETEQVDYLAAHGVRLAVPSGTVFDWIMSATPVDVADLSADELALDGVEPCDHVAERAAV